MPRPDTAASLGSLELKAFIPARDFALSKVFYAELGFFLCSEGDGTAYFRHGQCAFLLQDFWVKDFAENMVMHLLVKDVSAWHTNVVARGLESRFGSLVTDMQAQPWGITEFVVIDPAGVCWHIGQNTPGFQPVGRFPDSESSIHE